SSGSRVRGDTPQATNTTRPWGTHRCGVARYARGRSLLAQETSDLLPLGPSKREVLVAERPIRRASGVFRLKPPPLAADALSVQHAPQPHAFQTGRRRTPQEAPQPQPAPPRRRRGRRPPARQPHVGGRRRAPPLRSRRRATGGRA